MVCALLERWPALEELHKLRLRICGLSFASTAVGIENRPSTRMEAIRQAVPAIHDRAVIEAKSAAVRVIVRVVRVLGEGIEDLDGQIEEAAAAHPDFSSLIRCLVRAR